MSHQMLPVLAMPTADEWIPENSPMKKRLFH
jgi:hypothetical protein